MPTTLEKSEELVYRRFEETDRCMARSNDDFHRRMKKSDKRFKEAMKRLSEQISDVTDPIGRFAESAVYPAVIPLFKK